MELRNLVAFGTGVGIEIRGRGLAVTLVRVRPSGVDVVAAASIADFRERPAAEWGMEYAQLLKRNGMAHLAATVVLPRREVIVRQIALPGVESKDLESAISFQIESLHPYGDEEVSWGWQRLDASNAAVGIVRNPVMTGYHDKFVEAGVKVAAFTFSASAMRGAIRLPGAPPVAGFLAAGFTGDGEIEVYGESPARPMFTANLDLSFDRATALARAELRLDESAEALPLARIAPPPRSVPQEFDLAAQVIPYSAAISSATPWLAPSANLLPPTQRVTNSRMVFLPTAVLGLLLLLSAGAMWGYQVYSDRQYLRALQAEIRRVEPEAKKAQAFDNALTKAQNRERVLDEFRGRAKADLDALQELTRIIEPPVWLSSTQLNRDSAQLSGEAEQAAVLLKTLDNSPYFQHSSFALAIVRGQTSENFRIRTEREAQHPVPRPAAAPKPAAPGPQAAAQPQQPAAGAPR